MPSLKRKALNTSLLRRIRARREPSEDPELSVAEPFNARKPVNVIPNIGSDSEEEDVNEDEDIDEAGEVCIDKIPRSFPYLTNNQSSPSRVMPQRMLLQYLLAL